MPTRPDDTIRCSFCGRAQDQVRKMTAGAGNNNVYICNECIELCSEILEEELEGQDEGESPTLADICFLKPKEVKVFLDEYVIGQDDVKKVLSVAVHNHYKRMTVCQNMDVDVQKSNILTVGPTGSGKTRLAQALIKTPNVPFAIADITTLTGIGYVGEDVENILLKLIQATDYDISRAEYGIIYIDEIDEIIKKSGNVPITRGVLGEGVQQALPKTLEGTVVNVPPQGGRKHPHQEPLQIDTTSTLLVCGGAFDGLEKIVEQRLSASPTGLNAKVVNKSDLNIDELLKKVGPKDLTKFGLIPEFTGRVSVMVSLEQLTRDVMVRTLSEPKNALMRQCQKLFELDSVKLEFTQETLEEIAQLVINRKTGARGLCSILESAMMDFMYEIPFDDSIGICTVAGDVVKKAEQPELVYHDMPPVSTRKPLSEWLGGDSKTGEIAQAAMLLRQFRREKGSLQIRYDLDQKACFPAGLAPALQRLFKQLRYER